MTRPALVLHAAQHEARQENGINQVLVGDLHAVRHQHLDVETKIVPDELATPQWRQGGTAQWHLSQVNDKHHHPSLDLCRYLQQAHLGRSSFQ